MFYWDPKPEIFVIPYFNLPILWYGVLFTIGFLLGSFAFASILRRFFLNDPEYMESDILCPDKLGAWGKSRRLILKALNLQIEREEIKKLPKRMKQLVKKSNCLNPKKALSRISLDLELGDAVLGIYRKATLLTDRAVIYMLIATIVGARLGHFLFYEKPSEYLKNPLEIFRIWEGGLASHGGYVAIIFALLLFSYRVRKVARGLSWTRLLDFVCAPAILCGGFIRIGNFFNQEVLGVPTSAPWGVVFGHPAGGGMQRALHPVQLYEALLYFFVFSLLWSLSYRPKFLLAEGKLIGLALIVAFSFRFLVEFIKLEQSELLSGAPLLNMGQILSIPMILFGVFFICKSAISRR